MRKLTYILSAGLFIVLVVIVTNVIGAWTIFQKDLFGYIEVFESCESQRYHLKTASIETLPKDCRIFDYELGADGAKKIVRTDNHQLVIGYGTAQEKVIKQSDGMIEMAISPDSKKIAYLFWTRTKDLWQINGKLFVMNIDGSGDRKVFDSPIIRSKPSWFSDSRRIAISTFGHEIFIIDIETGEKEKIINFGIMPSVSPDGKKIAYLSHDVTSDIRKKIIAYDNLSEDQYFNVMKSPQKEEYNDITLKYFMENSIYIYDIKTKQTQKISESFGIEEPVLWSQDNKYLAFTDRKNLFALRYIKVINVQTRQITKLRTSFVGMLRGWIYIEPDKTKK